MSGRSICACRRSSSPACARARSSLTSSCPALVGNAGRIGAWLGTRNAQRRAITRVLASASGRSANSSAISAALFSRCSGVARRLWVWATWAPSAMHNRTSCASHSAASMNCTSLVATRGNSRSIARSISAGSIWSSTSRPWRISSMYRRPGKSFPQAIEQPLGAAAVAARQRTPDRPLRTAGQRDQAVAVGRELIELELRGGAGLAIQVGAAQQLHQVAVTGLVLHQHRQPGRQRGPTVAARLLVAGDRQQAADDRLHAGLRSALAELQRGKQVGPVGDGHRRHALARDPRDQFGRRTVLSSSE